MMHIGPFCARKGAIPGEAITAAIPIGLRAAVKTRLSAVRTFNILRSTSCRICANARRLVSTPRCRQRLRSKAQLPSIQMPYLFRRDPDEIGPTRPASLKRNGVEQGGQRRVSEILAGRCRNKAQFATHRRSSRWRDTIASTQDACATQN